VFHCWLVTRNTQTDWNYCPNVAIIISPKLLEGIIQPDRKDTWGILSAQFERGCNKGKLHYSKTIQISRKKIIKKTSRGYFLISFFFN
jgi:hypothetical protein